MQSAHTWRNPASQFLATPEAAEYIGVHKSTLDTWRCRGEGPRFLKLGRSVRYRICDLDAYLESRLCGVEVAG